MGIGSVVAAEERGVAVHLVVDADGLLVAAAEGNIDAVYDLLMGYACR